MAFRFRHFLPLLALSTAAALAVPAPLPRDPAILGYPLLSPEVGPGSGRPLLVSNSPETVRSPGLLYRDRVTGAARLLAYHANGLDRPARLLVEARNPGLLPVVLTPLRRGSAVTPGPDPLIGQQSLLRYFASGPLSARTVPAGGHLSVYDSGPLFPDEVVSLLLDLHVSGDGQTAGDHQGAVQVSVYLLPGAERPGPATPVLDPDPQHQRGTFSGADREWRVQLPAGPVSTPARLTFGGPPDPPLIGVDALTGRPQVLRGNYGVLYHLTLQGAAGSQLAVSARGGSYRGSLTLQDGPRSTPLLIGRGSALTDALPAALWTVRSDVLRLEFVPASGSNLPLALIVYPVSPATPPLRPGR